MQSELYLIISPTHHMDTLLPAETAKAFISFLDETMPGHEIEAKPVKVKFDLTLAETELKAFVSQA